jgi:hypothetical protein
MRALETNTRTGNGKGGSKSEMLLALFLLMIEK